MNTSLNERSSQHSIPNEYSRLIRSTCPPFSCCSCHSRHHAPRDEFPHAEREDNYGATAILAGQLRTQPNTASRVPIEWSSVHRLAPHFTGAMTADFADSADGTKRLFKMSVSIRVSSVAPSCLIPPHPRPPRNPRFLFLGLRLERAVIAILYAAF